MRLFSNTNRFWVVLVDWTRTARTRQHPRGGAFGLLSVARASQSGAAMTGVDWAGCHRLEEFA